MPNSGVKVVAGFHVVSSRDPGFIWLANSFSSKRIFIDVLTYSSTQHYFQAQKFPGISNNEIIYRNEISLHAHLMRTTAFSKYAKMLAQKFGLSVANDWDWDGDEEKSLQVMRRVVKAKLDQNSHFREQLMALPIDTVIIESTKYDHKWGDAGSAKGQNLLGRVYMEQLILRKNNFFTEEKQKLNLPKVVELAKKRYQAYNQQARPFFNRHPHLKNVLIGFGVVLGITLVTAGIIYALPYILAAAGATAAAAVLAKAAAAVAAVTMKIFAASCLPMSAPVATGVGYGALGLGFSSLCAMVIGGVSKIRQRLQGRHLPRPPAPEYKIEEEEPEWHRGSSGVVQDTLGAAPLPVPVLAPPASALPAPAPVTQVGSGKNDVKHEVRPRRILIGAHRRR